MKRYSSHYLYVPECGWLKQQIVEVEAGYAIRWFPMSEEVEDVEWFPGAIILFRKALSPIGEGTPSDNLPLFIPYLYYPFDFKAMQPVAGTQRRRLQ